MRAFDPDLEVVVVSDGSVDRTAEVAAAHGAHVVRLPFNLGIGGAVQTGFQYAATDGYELVVRCDGDGQHDPSELGKVLAPVLHDEADIAVGSRFTGDGGYRSSATRRVGIRLLAVIVSAIARQRVTDTTSGFQALNRKAIELFAADYPHDYPEVEGMVMTIRHQLRLREVPVRMRERAARAIVDHGAALDLLHGEGAARALRRPVPAAGRARRGRMIGAATPLKVSIAATAASLILVLVVFELIRSRRLRERYALLWLLTGVVLVVLSAWRSGLNTIAALARSPRLPAGRALRGRAAVRDPRPAALLDGDLPARRPERDPRAAPGAARDEARGAATTRLRGQRAWTETGLLSSIRSSESACSL